MNTTNKANNKTHLILVLLIVFLVILTVVFFLLIHARQDNKIVNTQPVPPSIKEPAPKQPQNNKKIYPTTDKSRQTNSKTPPYFSEKKLTIDHSPLSPENLDFSNPDMPYEEPEIDNFSEFDEGPVIDSLPDAYDAPEPDQPTEFGEGPPIDTSPGMTDAGPQID